MNFLMPFLIGRNQRNRMEFILPRLLVLCSLACGLDLLLAGCAAPVSAKRVSPREAYAEVSANALRTGKLSANTVAVLHRYNLDALASSQPEEAVRQLHGHALATGQRDLLFALAELSYEAGDEVRRSVK